MTSQPEPASANSFATPSAPRVAAASHAVTNSGPQRRMTTRSASQNARPVRERRAPIFLPGETTHAYKTSTDISLAPKGEGTDITQ